MGSRLNEIAKYAEAQAKKPKKAPVDPEIAAGDAAADQDGDVGEPTPVPGAKKPLSGKQKAAVAIKLGGLKK